MTNIDYLDPDRRPRARRNWLIYSAVGVVALVVGAVTFLVVATPTGLVRDEIIREVRAATGRDVTIRGATSVTFWPSAGVTIGDLAVAAPAGFGGGPTARIARLDARVALWPLLRGDVRIDSIVLQRPVFDLRIDAQGRPSWDFAPDASGGSQRGSGSAGTSASAPKGSASRPASRREPQAAVLGEIRVEDGVVRLLDERTGRLDELTALELRLAQSSGDGLEFSGSTAYRGEKLGLDGRVGSLAALERQEPAPFDVKLSGRPLTAAYSGLVSARADGELDGKLRLEAASLDALSRWLDAPLPTPPSAGPFKLEANIKGKNGKVTVSEADILLDGARVTGAITVTEAGKKPSITAALDIDTLDLAKFALHESGGQQAPPPAPRAPPASGARRELPSIAGPAPAPLGPGRPAQTGTAGWSDERFDFAFLDAADVDATLNIGRIRFEDVDIGRTQIVTVVKGRVLRADIKQMQLYGGRARGAISVDAMRSVPAIGVNILLEGVSVEPLFQAAAGLDWIAGKGKLAIAFAGQGHSERQVVETLNGNVEVVVTDGTLGGINIAQVIRNLQQGDLSGSGAKRAAAESTDFSELAATFAIVNGVARNTDLRMASPLLRLTGSGTADLKQRTLDYAIRPKLVASLKGQGGGGIDLTGIEVPIKVSGSWEDPQFDADIDSVINNPDKVVDTVRQLGKQLKGTGVDEVIRDILGDGKGADGTKPPSKTQKFLKDLFK